MKTTIVKIFAFLVIAGSGGTAALATPSNHPLMGAGAHAANSTSVLPKALQPVFYQSLVNHEVATYNLNKNGCATLPNQGLKACFDINGAHFNGARALSLHLVAFGRGLKLTPVSRVQPRIAGRQVNYAHGNLSEWWRVLPIGFEQGFTVTNRPRGGGELTLALAANGKASRERGTLAWGQLRYGRLVVTDATGKVVPARMETKGDQILIAVNDAHASYPLTVDPLIWLEQKVVGDPNDELGYAVAVKGDTAFISVPDRAIHGNVQQGGVEVFTKTDGTWTLSQVISANDSEEFGTFVSFDGTSVLIGAPYTNVNGIIQAGSAYIFNKVNGAWVQTAQLVPDDPVQSGTLGFGGTIAGNVAFVGAVFPYFGWQESVYVFTKSNGSWSQTQKIVSPNQPGDSFGYLGSIAIDGTTAIVGASGANVGGNAVGNATVYTLSNGTWTQTQQLTRSNSQIGDKFGIGVSMEDGTALISADGVNGGTGEVDVFTQSGGTWTQTGTITATDGVAGDLFGRMVALDGDTALVGADGYNSLAGKAYIFKNVNGTWTQNQVLIPSDQPAGAFFGYSGALSGSTAIVGAWFANIAESQGFAYFYDNGDLGLALSAPESVGQGQNYTSQTIATNNATASSPAVSATITVPAAASFVSATASQGSCSEASGVVTCSFGQISGNAGTATANVTLKATGNVGDTIDNVAGVAKATPPVSAGAPTTIIAGGACPDGYTEYDSSLNPGTRAHSPVYYAPAGMENAILTGPSGFQLYAVFQNAQGRKIYRIPGNEVHRRAPAGYFTWVVEAGDTGGAFTLCLMHP